MRQMVVVIAAMLIGAVAALGASHWPEPDGEALWSYITESDYASWKLYPGKGELYRGVAPHGTLLTTYVNKEALMGMRAGTITPYGAMIVKENYDDDANLLSITVMYKVEGYNTQAGDWFWAKYQPDGTVDIAGAPDGCINCHRSAKANDWVLTSVYVRQ